LILLMLNSPNWHFSLFFTLLFMNLGYVNVDNKFPGPVFQFFGYFLTYPDSLFELKVIVSMLVFVSIQIILWKLRSEKVVLFSDLSIFLFLFPVLNIIPSASTIVTLVSLRWLYLPMTFLALGIASILSHIPANYKKAVYICLIAIKKYNYQVYNYIN